MVSHSLIVGALMTFSLAVQAGVVAIDGMSIGTETATAMANAALHKDVGLQQGGGNGKDAWEAPVSDSRCEKKAGCSQSIASHPRAETLADLLAINKESTGKGSLLLLLLLLVLVITVYSRRSPSTK